MVVSLSNTSLPPSPKMAHKQNAQLSQTQVSSSEQAHHNVRASLREAGVQNLQSKRTTDSRVDTPCSASPTTSAGGGGGGSGPPPWLDRMESSAPSGQCMQIAGAHKYVPERARGYARVAGSVNPASRHSIVRGLSS